MTIFFLIAAAVAIAGTAAAMSLRNPIHCILALTAGLVGLAGLYLELGAQFVGFTQVLVYVGAVAILAVFAIMMTRGGEPKGGKASEGLLAPAAEGSSWLQGGLIAVVVFGVLAWAMRPSGARGMVVRPEPVVSVNEIGDALMHRFALPLEIVGLLLTTALIGAVIVAMPEKRSAR